MTSDNAKTGTMEKLTIRKFANDADKEANKPFEISEIIVDQSGRVVSEEKTTIPPDKE